MAHGPKDRKCRACGADLSAKFLELPDKNGLRRLKFPRPFMHVYLHRVNADGSRAVIETHYCLPCRPQWLVVLEDEVLGS